MISVEESDGLVTITLDRVEKRNALTRELLTDLIAAVDYAGEDAKALVITARGSVFCAGADLREVAETGLDTDPRWEDLSGRIASLPFPTLAAINGAVVGGGFGMILACDMRIAVPDATFLWPVVTNGLSPRPADPVRLTALVGAGRARFMLLSAERIPAEEALAWGLVDRLVAPEALQAEARRLLSPAIAARREHVMALKGMTP